MIVTLKIQNYFVILASARFKFIKILFPVIKL